MKKFVSTLIILSIITVPVVVLAEEREDACAQAYIHVDENLNTKTWWHAGFWGTSCLGPSAGVVAVALANTMKPYPSGSELLGKPPEYIEEYTYCYQNKGSDLQTKNAIKGALWGIPVFIAVYGGIFLVVGLSL